MSRSSLLSVQRCLLAVFVAGLSGSCTVSSDPLFDDVEPLAPLAGRTGNLPNFSQRPLGSGGRAGSSTGSGEGAPTGITRQGQNGTADGGVAADAGLRADAGDGGAGCGFPGECDDGNPCTLDACTNGACQSLPSPTGTACGSASGGAECSGAEACDGAGRCVATPAPANTPCGRLSNTCAADRCDGAGACVASNLAANSPCGSSNVCGQSTCNASGVCEPHPAANGSACTGGSCTVGACIQGQRVGCPRAVATSVPFETAWNSQGQPDLFNGPNCDSDRTPEFAVQFTAPAAGRYRFDASGSPDSVLVIVNGACGTGAPLECDDDRNEDTRDSRVELTLTANQVVTVYVSEFEAGQSGQGTLRITAL
jgi:hypothetical protein